MSLSQTATRGGLDATERAALGSAARWHAHLQSGEATDADRRDWERWHRDHPAHRWAWQRVEALQARLQSIPGAPCAAALTRLPPQRAAVVRQRRAVLKGLALVAFTGWAASATLQRTQPTADHRSGIGRIRSVQLPDGSLMLLNTDTAVSVDFDTRTRRVHLHRGEILITTAADPGPTHRPFVVHSAQGRIQALGTRFSVRQLQDRTRIAVLEHAVEIRTAREPLNPVLLRAGHRLDFSAHAAQAAMPADDSLVAWRHGRVVVSDWTLAELTEELARYRPGWLRCAPEVAALRISGAFPLHDIDAALAAVERALPVQARRRGRYWITLAPSEADTS